MRRMLKAGPLAALRIVVAAAILIHDLLTWLLARPLALIARLRPLVRLSAWVATLPPWAVLAVLALPVAATEPFKVLGLWWIAVGQGKAGLLALAFGHGVSLVLVERIVSAGLPALRRYRWLAALHDRFVAFRRRVTAWAAALPFVRELRRSLAGVRLGLRTWMASLRAALPKPRGS